MSLHQIPNVAPLELTFERDIPAWGVDSIAQHFRPFNEWVAANEPGVRCMHFSIDVKGDAAIITTNEVYEDKAAYEAHMQSVAMEVLTAGLDPLTNGPPRISIRKHEQAEVARL